MHRRQKNRNPERDHRLDRRSYSNGPQDLLASWSSWQGQLSHCTYNRFACAELRQTRIVLLLLPGQTGGKASRKVIPTIARDLAAWDIRLKPILADALALDPSLSSTPDVMQQWQKLILEPLSRLEGAMIGNVVVVIDALDESGDDATRQHILGFLTSPDPAELPSNLRILVTCRPEADIRRGLNSVRHIKSRSLDDSSECPFVRFDRTRQARRGNLAFEWPAWPNLVLQHPAPFFFCIIRV